MKKLRKNIEDHKLAILYFIAMVIIAFLIDFDDDAFWQIWSMVF